MSYTKIVKQLLDRELRSTDTTAELLLPIRHEILNASGCLDRGLLCEKLLVEARVFNRTVHFSTD